MPWIIWSRFDPNAIPLANLYVEPLSISLHSAVFIKSVIVAGSWTFAYFALQHLPVTIASPIRSTSPLWTILIATVIYAEHPTKMQWLGIALVMTAVAGFSISNLKEPERDTENRYLLMMVLATILAAISGIYDKYLLQHLKLSVAATQAWFSVYLVVVLTPLFIHWWITKKHQHPFEWRFSVAAIALMLIVADYFYFTALADPRALVTIVSTLRRTSTLVSFALGVFLLSEKITALIIYSLLILVAGTILISLYGD